MNTATPAAETPEPSAPADLTLTARADILRHVNRAPQTSVCIRIHAGDGAGFGHIWLSKKQALALLDQGELDGFTARLIEGNLLILNHEFTYALVTEHKTDRYRALVARAEKQGYAVGEHISAFLAKRSAPLPAPVMEHGTATVCAA